MSKPAVVIGGGPAGLMAAEQLADGGHRVDVYDAMPSVGRKFLLAGIGGMNITHAEPFDAFISRYGDQAGDVRRWLGDFSPETLREWIHALGIETFVGSSGRVFPREMKAAPLLRAWLHRLRAHGVQFHVRHRWQGWDAQGRLRFRAPGQEPCIDAAAVVLALGGASWPRLGSDAAWVPWLRARGVAIHPFRSSNAGFEIAWTEHFLARYAGEPVKPVVLGFTDAYGVTHSRRGEFIATRWGIEGSLVYALSGPLRETLQVRGFVDVTLDLAPDRDIESLQSALGKSRGRRTLAEHLRRQAGIHGVKAGLLREGVDAAIPGNADALAARIKALPLRLHGIRPIEEAISSAGGVAFSSMNEQLMLQEIPGVFCAGEMLDWEAPTGGYLLTACLASGRIAGQGAAAWLQGM